VQRDKEDNLMFFSLQPAFENTSEKKWDLSLDNSYQYLFFENPSPMLIWDFKTLKILECNKEVMDKYGYTKEEFLQLSIKDIRPEEDIALFEEFIKSEESYGKYQPIRRHKKKNGELLYMHVTSH